MTETILADKGWLEETRGDLGTLLGFTDFRFANSELFDAWLC